MDGRWSIGGREGGVDAFSFAEGAANEYVVSFTTSPSANRVSLLRSRESRNRKSDDAENFWQ